MRPTLKHTPSHYTYRDLMVKFAEGKPLSCDQLNFLSRHEKTLSHPHMDQVMKYYLKKYHHDYAEQHSFLMPGETFTPQSAEQLKERLSMLLDNQVANLELKMTPEQFLQFKAVTYGELILYHGNQFLSGAPFHPGGIPHLIYFQWGNLFGVAKYVVMAEEKALKTNVLIYFEDLLERKLEECINQFNQRKLKLAAEPPIQAPVPQPKYTSIYKTPTLSLSKGSKERDEK